MDTDIIKKLKDRIRPDWKPCSRYQMIWTRGNEFPWTHNQFENFARKPKNQVKDGESRPDENSFQEPRLY